MEEVYLEYKIKYQRKGLGFDRKRFNDLKLTALKQSGKRYEELDGPKLLTKDLYNRFWLKVLLAENFGRKTMRSFKPTDPPPDLKKTAQFMIFLHPEIVRKLFKKIYDAKSEQRKKIWENLNLPLRKIEKDFLEMVNENQGRRSLEFCLEYYKIPKSDYKKFLIKVDKVIEYCNQQLPEQNNLPDWFYSEFNNFPCFICRLKKFPFSSYDDVFSEMSKKYSSLSKFKNKIEIKDKKVEYSKVSYIKEKDVFEISLDNKQNFRHRCMDLIHELGHVIGNIQTFEKGKLPAEIGSFKNEKQAFKYELEFLNDFSTDLYRANFAPILSNLVRVLFELSLNENVNHNPNKLFAEAFNRCFKKAKQKSNYLYLVEERILYRQFQTLPHAVAEVDVINNLLPKHDVKV